MAGSSAEKTLQKLADGNARFATQKMEFPNLNPTRIRQTGAKGQQPFAAVLACSDSRCPVEQIFDAGVGDLFSVRIAGNIASNEVIGSLEFCTGELGVQLIVVMGHTDCGAVKAAITGARTFGHIPRVLVAPLKAMGRVQKHSPGLAGKDLGAAVVIENIWLSIEEMLRNSRSIGAWVDESRLVVVGAVYHVDTGLVEWLGQHPRQRQLAR